MKVQRHKKLIRLATKKEWQEARRSHEFTYTQRDQRDGRFHLSTVGLFLSHCWVIHRGRQDIYALEIPFERIGHNVFWRESDAVYPDGSHPLCPYLQSPLTTDCISEVKLLKPGFDGRFMIDTDFIRRKMIWETGA